MRGMGECPAARRRPAVMKRTAALLVLAALAPQFLWAQEGDPVQDGSPTEEVADIPGEDPTARITIRIGELTLTDAEIELILAPDDLARILGTLGRDQGSER